MTKLLCFLALFMSFANLYGDTNDNENRKGGFWSVGGGPGFIAQHLEREATFIYRGRLISYEDKILPSVAGDVKVGIGVSQRFQIYWSVKPNWSMSDNIMLAGYGLGFRYYLSNFSPSFSIASSFGFHRREEDTYDPESSIGLSLSVGYEMIKSWEIEVTGGYGGETRMGVGDLNSSYPFVSINMNKVFYYNSSGLGSRKQ